MGSRENLYCGDGERRVGGRSEWDADGAGRQGRSPFGTFAAGEGCCSIAGGDRVGRGTHRALHLILPPVLCDLVGWFQFSSCEVRRGGRTRSAAGPRATARGPRQSRARERINPKRVRGWISRDNAHFLALRLRGPHVRLEIRLTLRGVLHFARQEPGEPPHGVRPGRRRSRGTREGMTGRAGARGEPNRAHGSS